jgi:cupin 2 domain-containing protein
MNLFADLPDAREEEVLQTVLAKSSVRIERIVSQGQASPPDFWYDQSEHEWVLLLQGAARINIEGKLQELRPGDSVDLPAGCRHRVEWTTKEEPTIWLAVFYG